MTSSARVLLCITAVSSILALLPAIAACGTTPELAVVGGTGILGGTVGVVIQLSHDADNTGVAADLDIRFPTDLVEFHAPVIINCRIAGRLAATHHVAGAAPEAGLVRLAFIPRDLVLLPFHEGELATCDFRILSGADAPSAALT